MRALFARLRQRLFRWQSDGTQPIRLGQRRIFILPSAGGLRYALLLIVMLLAAINYQLALGHALVFLLAGLGIVGMIHTFRNLHQLEITPVGSPPVFAGETALFRLQLHNTRPTPRPALCFQVPGEAPATVHLAGSAAGFVDIPVLARQRGRLPLPRLQLSSDYPLGLYRAWAYLQPAMSCTIYPRPLDTPLPPASATNDRGGLSGQGGEEDFSGLRERQPADSPRHVHWKASARDDGQRPLQVKQFADGARAELRLDWQLTLPADDETRLAQLCGWVLAAEAAGLSYALILPDAATPCAHGPDHCRLCLERLALYPA